MSQWQRYLEEQSEPEYRMDRCCVHSPSLLGGRHSGVVTKRGRHTLCRLAEQRSAYVLLATK